MKQIKTYRDFVERFRESYYNEIKPLIEAKSYEIARVSLKNIVLEMKMNEKIFNLAEISKIHCGLNLMASIQVLHDSLGKKGFDPREDTKHLEGYLDQTQLPTQEKADSAR